MGTPSSDGFEICETPPAPRHAPAPAPGPIELELDSDPASPGAPSQPDAPSPSPRPLRPLQLAPSSSPEVPLAGSRGPALSSDLSAMGGWGVREGRPRRLLEGGGVRAGVGVLELGSSDEEAGEGEGTQKEDEIEIVSYKAASRLSLALSDHSSDDLPPPDQLGLGHFNPRRQPITRPHPHASTSALPAPLPRSLSTASEHRPSALPPVRAHAAAAGSKDKGKGKGRPSAAPLEVLGDSDSETDGELGLGPGREVDPYDAMLARKRKLPPGVGVAVARGVSDSALTTGGPPLKKKASTASASTSTLDKASAKEAAASARAAKAAAKASEAAYAKAHRSANTLQSDRKKTVAELTCHLDGLGLVPPSEGGGGGAFSLPPRRGARAKESVWPEVARGLGERLGPYSCEVVVGGKGGVYDLRSEGAVRWTRVCDRRWDDATAQFVPLGRGNEVTVEEDSRLIFMTALELSSLIARDELPTHIATVQTLLPPHVHLFLMVSGLGALFAKMRSAKNRQYKNGVTGHDDAGAAQGAAAGVGIGENQPDKDAIEIELVKLETAQGLFLIRVESPTEAVDWLEQLTFDVGFKPHARHRLVHAAALGGSGDDKLASGRDLQDSWIRILATLKAVTEPLAKAVVAEYPTVRELYEAWAGCGTERERREMLSGIRKGNKVNGAATDRSLGKALSERIYNFFTATNPDLPLN